jgi:alanine racemase
MLNLIIDKNKIIKNIKKIEQFASKYKFDYKFYVVKSNAYGYGLKEIVKIILEQKCTRFAVARFEEALQIRAISKTAEIMILGMIDDKYINIAIKNKFYIPICNNDQLKRYSLMNVKNLKCELAINTGMNRIGFNNETDLLNAYKCMKENGAEIVGIFSHFFNTSNLEVCKKQANMFNKFVQCIPEWKNIKYRSLRASGGIDNTRYIPKTLVENTCRPGACIFG